MRNIPNVDHQKIEARMMQDREKHRALTHREPRDFQETSRLSHVLGWLFWVGIVIGILYVIFVW
jgi:hypothetical protein